MDCRRPLAALLIAGACVAAGPSTEVPIREARWIAPEARLAVLSGVPGICLLVPKDAEQLQTMATGMAAFRTPLLLGGQAARAGLSCNSCHISGGGNPHFRFPGLSGEDGTADVTSSIMSSHRGDRIFNPKPIPDLAASPSKVSRDPENGALRAFIRGLIVEEFDGPAPSPGTLDALVAYVRALGGKGCATVPAEPASASLGLIEASGMMWLASAAIDRNDPTTARLMVASARSSLGRVYERFDDRALSRQRALIEQLDDDLLAIRAGLGGDMGKTRDAILAWSQAAKSAGEVLRKAEPKSLFNREKLKAALEGAR